MANVASWRSGLIGTALGSMLGIAIVVMLAAPASAMGWKTVVEDRSGGIRIAELKGLPGGDPEIGVALICDADSSVPAVLTAVFGPSGDFTARPGDAATLTVAGLRIEGVLDRNDSDWTSMWIEFSDAAAVFDALSEAAGDIGIGLEADTISLDMVIPAGGLDESLAMIAQVCPGLT